MSKKKKCTCGKYDECIREIHSTKRGKLYIKTNEHFQCGIIQEQIEQGVKLLNSNYNGNKFKR